MSSEPSDPLRSIAALADAIGASGLASEARRFADVLDHARCHVALIGPAVDLGLDRALLDGACVVAAADLEEARALVPRIDLAIDTARTSPAEARARIIARVGEHGGENIAQLRRHEALRLGARLEQYLLEERQVLALAPEAGTRQVFAAASCRRAVAVMRERRHTEPDPVRAELATVLDTERRKLVMATTADVAATVHDRLARRTLEDAYRIAREVAGDRVLAWYRGLRPVVDELLRAGAARLLSDTRDGLGTLADAVPLAAFAGLSIVPRADTFELLPAQIPALWDRVADRVRSRAARDGCNLAVELLHREARRAVAAHLAYYDDAMDSTAATLAGAVEQLAIHRSVALDRARLARRAGRGAVGQAVRRVEDWLARLAEVMAQNRPCIITPPPSGVA